MKTSSPSSHWRVLAAIALAAAAGCSTLQYRTIQSRFESAVRADNERFTMPFTDVTSQYRDVAGELTPDRIARLDEKLRPGAWTIRAVSLWRAGEFAQAVAGALEGLAEITRQKTQMPHLEHGRDGIILTMLPGLVEDSRLRERFNERGPADVAAHYDEYDAKFRTALRALVEARQKAGLATPPEVIAYWHYQCWRVLQNWSVVIAQLPLDAMAGPIRDANAFVKDTLADTALQGATDLPTAVTIVENALPKEHPYRQLIALERQR